jgi:putative ABC transport system permease protein
MDTLEISEVAVRTMDFDHLTDLSMHLQGVLDSIVNKQNQPILEVHTWDQLTPFYNVVRMIDVMTVGIKVILIAVVLISVLNVMMMSVYERVREVGAMAAMGTRPGRIMALFVAEGFCLGLVSAVAGAAIGIGLLELLNLIGVDVAFGRANQVFTLAPSVEPVEVLLACLIVLGVSILASLQPAVKAARLEPVDALRHI